MKWVVHELALQLPLGLIVVTLLLSVGCACLMRTRSAAHRQKIGELTIAGVLMWILLAALPIPRLWPAASSRGTSALKAASAGFAETAEAAIRVDAPAASTQHGFVSQMDNAKIERANSPEDAGGLGSASVPVNVELSDALRHGRENGPASASGGEKSAASDGATRRQATGIAAVSTAGSHGPAEAEAELGWLGRAAGVFYLGAAAIAAGWLVAGHILLIRERLTAESPSPWLYRILQSATEQWRGPLPRLLVSRRCARPLACGIWRPMILVPERMCRIENREQLKTVLLHELAHIRRGDALGNLLFEIAFPLLLAHPLYWWLRGQTRLAAELVADDWAAQHAGKEIYIMELVRLARSSTAGPVLVMSATSVFTSPSQFYRRMQMLLARENQLATRTSRRWRFGSLIGLATCVALATALAGTGPAIGDQPEKPKADEPRAVSDAPRPEARSSAEATPFGNALPAAGNQPGGPGAGPVPVGLPDYPPVTEPIRSTTTPFASQSTPPPKPTEVSPGSQAAPTAPLAAPAPVQLTLAEVKADNPAAIADEIKSLQLRLQQLLATQAAQSRKATAFEQYSRIDGAAAGTPTPENIRRPRLIQIFKTMKDVDGTTWSDTYELKPDGTIGRLMETHRLATTADDHRDSPSVGTGVLGTASIPVKAAQEISPTASDRPLDLVSLATNYSDAVSAVEMAKVHLSTVEKSVASNTDPEGVLLAARAMVQAAERKQHLLHRIVDVALASASQQLNRSVALHAQGALAAEALTEVQSRVDVLHEILNTGGDGAETLRKN